MTLTNYIEYANQVLHLARLGKGCTTLTFPRAPRQVSILSIEGTVRRLPYFSKVASGIHVIARLGCYYDLELWLQRSKCISIRQIPSKFFGSGDCCTVSELFLAGNRVARMGKTKRDQSTHPCSRRVHAGDVWFPYGKDCENGLLVSISTFEYDLSIREIDYAGEITR